MSSICGLREGDPAAVLTQHFMPARPFADRTQIK
jgi:hypothetical protein